MLYGIIGLSEKFINHTSLYMAGLSHNHGSLEGPHSKFGLDLVLIWPKGAKVK